MKSFQSFRLDEANQCLWYGETRVSLMPKPFAVLRYLVEHAGQLVTHEELLAAIWPDTYVQPEVLRRYILEIRKVLRDDADKPRFVETLPKRGYQFIASVADVSPDISFSSTVRLVGRQSALAALDGHFQNSLSGRRQIVFVTGEPGIGKTTLVDAFQQAKARVRGVSVARGQSVEGFGGKEAYYPIFEALSQLTRGNNDQFVIDTLATRAPTWFIQFPSLISADQRAMLEREIIGATRDRMVRELCEALEAMSATFALVLILEDLHLVDHSTLDLISAIARRREPAKLLLLATLRPADLIVSRSPLKELKHDLLLHRLGNEISLERLNESDVAEYLRGEFADGDFPESLPGVIYRHSDGNPLFMTAMLDHLEQRGVLSKANSHWQMTQSLEKVDPGVPETLRQMLEVQLQHLTNEQRELLRCASVAGEHFTAWSVATMMEADIAEIEEHFESLAEHQQFLKPLGPTELLDGMLSSQYEFRHSLYREVLYRQLNPSKQVAYHQILAHGLESLRSPEETEAAAEIALHFEQGREYDRAIQYLLLAAENATRRYAHRESIVSLEHALELLTKIQKERRAEFDVQLLERIGDAYYALGDMEKSAATYHLMATHASEAGLLTAQANALVRLAHSAEAIPFFLRAIELDPNFASAYVSLSRIYSNLGEVEQAKEFAKLAYERGGSVSERERLSITYQYHYEVTGDQSRASETLEIWKRSFPEEFQPPNSLAYIHNVLGDFQRAIEEGKEAVSRNPAHGFPYSNLAHAYRGLGRFDDALRTAEEAVKRNVETVPTRRLLYQLATMTGDHEAAAQHVEWARDRPREFEIVGARAQVAAYSGKIKEARQLYEETAHMAEQRNLVDVGTNHLAWATSMDLVYGNNDRASNEARRVLARNPSYDPRLRLALTLALTSSADDAEAITDELTHNNPEHTIINSVLAPIARAGVELAREEPTRAIEQLKKVVPYELGFVAALAPLYLRARAYLMQGSIDEAIKEFERLLDHRGSDPFSPYYAAAFAGLARAHALKGNNTASRQAYERFLSQWSEADSDVPLLRQARDEYASVMASFNSDGSKSASPAGTI
jgi:DNA-binding winged helix-turn-helix (wHTH) protein/tetratricopeptide (TPR) repeat protein